jgi:predicted negative regulator of RcsB-dependent stress response
MAKKKFSRKELVKEPDEFITFTGQAIRWARENARLLTYGACLFFGVIVLVSAYRLYSAHVQDAGGALLSQTRSAYQTALQADKDPAKALAAVKPQFERLVSEYGRWPAGRLGRVLYAHATQAGHAPDEAITLYRQALDDFKADPALSNSILSGLAAAYMEKGDSAAAITHLEQVVAGSAKTLKDTALFQLAALYKAAGQTEKSQQAYKQLSTDYPDSIYANIAKEKITG